MGDEPVRDVHGKIVGRIAGPALRHEEQIPGPIVGGDSVRGGRRRQTRSQGSNAQSKLPHRYSPLEWTRCPQSLQGLTRFPPLLPSAYIPPESQGNKVGRPTSFSPTR